MVATFVVIPDCTEPDGRHLMHPRSRSGHDHERGVAEEEISVFMQAARFPPGRAAITLG